MLKSLSGLVKRISSITDLLAGVCFFSVMALVLANIILRNVFRMPILGTVELVGLLTVTGLGFALANCEMLGGNIAMDVLMEKLSWKTQKVFAVIMYSIALGFWAIVVWRVFVYADTSFVNGRVTSTISIPLSPFIFILGINVFFLCIVLVYKLIGYINDAHAEFNKTPFNVMEEK